MSQVNVLDTGAEYSLMQTPGGLEPICSTVVLAMTILMAAPMVTSLAVVGETTRFVVSTVQIPSTPLIRV